MPIPSFYQAGVNYSETKSVAVPNFREDSKRYFKSIKHPDHPFPVRIMVKAQYESIPYPFDLGVSNGVDNFAYHHELMLDFASDPDFHVIFNVYAGPMTKDSFARSRQSIVEYAALLQDLGVAIELSIGNELADTYGIQYGIASCTRSGTTATLTCTGATFGTHVGDTFTLWGMAPSAWNGVYTVDSWDGNRTITFTVPNTLSTSATGSLLSMTVTQLNQNLRDLAADVKAVYPLGQVSCAEYGKTVNGVNNLTDWINNGPGALDFMSMHIYPGLYRSAIPGPEKALMLAYGDKTYISEFNVDSGSISAAGYQGEKGINAMRGLFKAMNDVGTKMAVIWSWDTNLNMHNVDGTFHPMWFVLTTNNGRMPLDMYSKTRSSVSRSEVGERQLVGSRSAI